MKRKRGGKEIIKAGELHSFFCTHRRSTDCGEALTSRGTYEILVFSCGAWLFILFQWPFLASGDSYLEPCTVVQKSFHIWSKLPLLVYCRLLSSHCLIGHGPLRERGWPSEGSLQVVAKSKCISYEVVQSLYNVTSKPSIVMMQRPAWLTSRREKGDDVKRRATNEQEKAMLPRGLTQALLGYCWSRENSSKAV